LEKGNWRKSDPKMLVKLTSVADPVKLSFFATYKLISKSRKRRKKSFIGLAAAGGEKKDQNKNPSVSLCL